MNQLISYNHYHAAGATNAKTFLIVDLVLPKVNTFEKPEMKAYRKSLSRWLGRWAYNFDW